MAKFIEDAVRWRVLDQIVAEARSKFVDMAPDELEILLGKAVAETREAFEPKAG
jgi:hypothetical protein